MLIEFFLLIYSKRISDDLLAIIIYIFFTIKEPVVFALFLQELDGHLPLSRGRDFLAWSKPALISHYPSVYSLPFIDHHNPNITLPLQQ